MDGQGLALVKTWAVRDLGYEHTLTTHRWGYGTGGQVAAEDTVVAEEEVKEEEANCSEWADESCNFSAS